MKATYYSGQMPHRNDNIFKTHPNHNIFKHVGIIRFVRK
jgi:hypothetical protein